MSLIKKLFKDWREAGSISAGLVAVGLSAIGILQTGRTISKVPWEKDLVSLEEGKQLAEFTTASGLNCSGDIVSCIEGDCIQFNPFEIEVISNIASHSSHQGCVPSDPADCTRERKSAAILSDDHGGFDRIRRSQYSFGSHLVRLCDDDH